MSTGLAERLVAPTRHDSAAHDPGPFSPIPGRLLLASLLLVGAVVSWRPDTLYSGGLDPVVAAKAVLTAVAFLLAVTPSTREFESPLPLPPILWLTVYLFLATVGALTGAQATASLVLVVRLALTATVVALLVRAYGAERTISGISTAMLAVGGVATLTGVSTVTSGRLAGGFPASTPNELAMLVGLPLILCWRRWVRGTATAGQITLLPLLAAILWLTGSRTALAALVIAGAVLYATSSRVSMPAFVGGILAVPLVCYVFTATSALSSVLERGGSSNLTTLSSRTIAWTSAIHLADDFWSRWFGAGLALKQIPVSALYWSTQILDSSVLSALVQTGWLGVLCLAGWAVTATFKSARLPAPLRTIWLPLLAFVLLRSVLESGLLDSTPMFLVFFVAACGASSKGGAQ